MSRQHGWDAKGTLLWFQKLKRWLELPVKPAHVDRLTLARRERFKHVGHRSPRRESYRVHWRREGLGNLALVGMSRRERRGVMLRQWRHEKAEKGAP